MPEDVVAILMNQVKDLPRLLERVEILIETTEKLDRTLVETSNELRRRDEKQQRAIEETKIEQSRIMAGMAAISSSVADMRSGMNLMQSKIDKSLEDIKSGMSSMQAKFEKSITDLAHSFMTELKEVDQKIDRLEESYKGLYVKLKVFEEKEKDIDVLIAKIPFLEALSWGLKIIGAFIITALIGAVFWALVNSGVVP